MGGVTDEIVGLKISSNGKEREGAEAALDRLANRHREALAGLALPESEARACALALDEELGRCRELSLGISLLKEISPRTSDALLSLGEIMYSRLVAGALRVLRGIPVAVRNTFRPNAPGTVVRKDAPGAGVRALAMRKGVTAVFVGSPRMLLAHGYAARVFSVFERHRVAVDVIATSEVSISITVDETSPVDGVVRDLSEFADVSILPHLAVVSVVGRALRTTAGIAVRVFGALGDVNVVLISQGASDTNMTFVVAEADAPEALRRLHREFFE